MNEPNKSMASEINCGICGKPLVYATESKTGKCSICGKEEKTLIYCPSGHYVCDACHSKSALEFLRQVLNETRSPDPAEVLEQVMAHPGVPMHGPEHHSIVPGVIVAAVRNAGYSIPAGAIEKALERASKVPGGWCGLYGDCGAGVGVGIAVSVITEATPLTGKQRTLAIGATSYALSKMLDEQPRCCKRASRIAVRAAKEYLKEHLNIVLPEAKKVKCTYVSRNQQCPHEECTFFGK